MASVPSKSQTVLELVAALQDADDRLGPVTGSNRGFEWSRYD